MYPRLDAVRKENLVRERKIPRLSIVKQFLELEIRDFNLALACVMDERISDLIHCICSHIHPHRLFAITL
jgi:hypothetical protein